MFACFVLILQVWQLGSFEGGWSQHRKHRKFTQLAARHGGEMDSRVCCAIDCHVADVGQYNTVVNCTHLSHMHKIYSQVSFSTSIHRFHAKENILFDMKGLWSNLVFKVRSALAFWCMVAKESCWQSVKMLVKVLNRFYSVLQLIDMNGSTISISYKFMDKWESRDACIILELVK